MDIQKGYNCSAFSTAFLLRHFGIEAEGNDIYNKMPGKMKSGYVYQKGIRQYFSEQGMKTYYFLIDNNYYLTKVNFSNNIKV